jgi:hypothetical protein
LWQRQHADPDDRDSRDALKDPHAALELRQSVPSSTGWSTQHHRLALKGESLRKPPEKSAKRGKLDTNDAE